MKIWIKVAVLSLACATSAAAQSTAAQAQGATAQQIVDEVLATDRAFAASAGATDTIGALSAMFHDDVIMPLPDGTFARGRAAATEALRGNPFNSQSRAEWAPIRGGVSADGQHAFTLGYMTLRGQDGSVRLAKYMAYWVRTPEGWRTAAYKRAPRPEGEIALDLMPASLPARLVAPVGNAATLVSLRQGLIAAEQAFSDEAQRIGIGPAFLRTGRDDATNFGNGPGYTIGAQAISQGVGGDSPESPVTWGADDALVASSGDLGITFGLIRPKGPPPEGRPAASPFFTIWRRDSPDAPWRYIAE